MTLIDTTAGSEKIRESIRGAQPPPGNGEDRSGEQTAPEPTPELPEEAWRGVFGDYRAAMQGTSEASDSAHFASMWAAVAVRLRRRVCIHYARTTFPNVYVINYGITGDSKTTAQRAADDLLPGEDRVRVLRGVGSTEGTCDWMQCDDEGVKVAHLLHLEELAALLTRGRWDGSTTLQFLTEAFDTPDVFEIPYRKNPVRVVEPTPTLLAATTPEWFWRSIREVDLYGGFGNRLFFVTGTPKPPIPLPKKADQYLLSRVRERLKHLDKLDACEGRLTADAEGVWNAFYMAWKETTRLLDPLTAAVTKRIHTYAIKLALTYAALESTLPDITCEQIVAAIKVAHFGLKCGEHLVRGRQQFSTPGRCEKAVAKALEHADLPPWKIHRQIGGRFTSEDLSRTLRAMQTTGAIIEVNKTSRREPIYRLRGGLRDV
jgi:hypothetical protein